MRKVIAYVDGFNLYHAIHELKKPRLKWLDLHKLAAGICGESETLVKVKYFSAFATWRVDAVGRHRSYVSALKHVGVECIMGHFKEKHRTCSSCGAKWIAHEEKETDVAIAVELVADAFINAFQRALVISAEFGPWPRHPDNFALALFAPEMRETDRIVVGLMSGGAAILVWLMARVCRYVLAGAVVIESYPTIRSGVSIRAIND